MKKKLGKAAIIIIVMAVLIVLGNSLFIIRENQYGIVKEFGRIEKVINEPGLYIKIPLVQEVDTVSKELLLYDIPKSDVITKDKKSMIADSFVLWRITDPKVFAQTLNSSTANAEGRIDVAVYNSIKNVISSMTQSDIIAARGQELTSYIMTGITSINQYGIEIASVEIKLLDLPEDNKDAVFQRMISERENIAATYTAEGNSEAQVIRNTTDKEAALLISEAEKQAEILKAYNDPAKADFYSFTRSLDALKNSIQGGNKTIILDKDSPLTQIFYQAQ